MKPQVPPKVLILVCPLTKAEQAKRIGVSIRNFYRMIERKWSDWRIWQAERWCEACGVGLWDLRFTPEMVRKVDWSSGDPATVAGVAAIYQMKHPGSKISRRELLKVGSGINRAFGIKGRDVEEEEVPCGPQD